MIMNRVLFISFLCCIFFTEIHAQELVVPIQSNPYLSKIGNFPNHRQRATLPFFDDFSYQSSLPNPSLWEDEQVFINNTFGQNVITQGVATFDGLNEEGRPYRPTNFGAEGFGDSLTSTPIDLSFNNPSDSIILSFWHQPQGNGFAPEIKDSLFLFFKNNNGDWNAVWQLRGTGTRPFMQAFVTVSDSQYFHANFQFRFVNYTSLNLNDDIWNIDYVEMDINRSHQDTTANDLAFTAQPTSILQRYTAMPFKHFLPADLSANQEIYVRNNYDVASTFTVRHRADELNSSSNISTNTLSPFNAIAKSNATLFNPSYALGLSGNGPFTVQNTYTVDPINVTDPSVNDTMITETVFDNYFAYDDGTSELAYFLTPALNQPAKTALRFELRQADTVFGVSVFFAAQVPGSEGKFFSLVLYDSLGNTTPGDVVIHQQDLFKVQYPTKRGEFSSYRFDTPVGLGPGTYYIGITQPANFGSDSIYYGLDVNTDNNINELSYNVNGFWFNSSVTGTVMIRPMVGASFTPTSVVETTKEKLSSIYPNPARQIVTVKNWEHWSAYEILDLNGRALRKERMTTNKIDVGSLANGTYFLKFENSNQTETHTICKQ